MPNHTPGRSFHTQRLTHHLKMDVPMMQVTQLATWKAWENLLTYISYSQVWQSPVFRRSSSILLYHEAVNKQLRRFINYITSKFLQPTLSSSCLLCVSRVPANQSIGREKRIGGRRERELDGGRREIEKESCTWGSLPASSAPPADKRIHAWRNDI